MEIFGILVVLGSLAGAFAFFTKDREKRTIDVYQEYPIYLNAAQAYRESNGDFAKEIKQLKPFMPKFDAVQSVRYGLSLDGKFLTVLDLEEDVAEKLINDVGGESYINGRYTYLTLRRHTDLSEVKPVAHFTIKPEGNISTTTLLTYDTAGCAAEDNEILEMKWENKRSSFRTPGFYTIKLKIRDRNGNWSDYFEREIKVVEVPGIRELESYDNSFFMLYKNGKVLCRGKNENGQLGIGSLSPMMVLNYQPVHDGIVEISCGEGFNLFRTLDGKVYAAGTNRYGELATGDKTNQKVTTEIWGLEKIKQISSGRRFGAALDVFGDVFAWGDNSEDQLVLDEGLDSVYPIKIEGLSDIKQISCGSNFGLALKYDGTVMGWGDNTFGQLGVGYKGRVTEPLMTLFKNVKSVHAGDRFSLVVTENGRVFGAGNNAYGQIGFRGKSEILFPQEVPKIKDVLTLRVKESLTLMISTTGRVAMWGNINGPGQKPIPEPFEIADITYAKAYTNNGKKCFVIDGANVLHIISDISGRNERHQMYENFSEFIESNDSKEI